MVSHLAVLVRAAEEVNEKEDLYPQANELIVGAVAFGVLFFFIWKWALPRLNKVLDERREKIQGSLEQAESSRAEAQSLLADYKRQLDEARGESNRIIEEARKSAEAMRKDLLARAEDEARQVVARAQEEIRAERDRVFEELRGAVGELSIQVAERVVGESLTKDRQAKLVDDYITEIAKKKG